MMTFCPLDSIVGDLEIFYIFFLNTVKSLMTPLLDLNSEITELVKPPSDYRESKTSTGQGWPPRLVTS